MSARFATAFSVSFSVAVSATAAPVPQPAVADVADTQPAPMLAPSEQPLPPAPPPRDDTMEAARFSGKRFVVEILAGAVVGSAVAYGTYESLCDGRGDCLGAGLAGFGMNFAVTPLAVYGVGRWMGGQGSLGWTYVGGLTALSAFSAPGSPDETPDQTISRINIEFAISTLLLPVTSAAFYELSSHVRYTRWHQQARLGTMSAGIAPLYAPHGVDGAMGQMSLTF
jgi:hypothetical protein